MRSPKAASSKGYRRCINRRPPQCAEGAVGFAVLLSRRERRPNGILVVHPFLHRLANRWPGRRRRMTESSSQRTVSFAHPFSLSGMEGTFPAGTYAVEETREQVEGLSFIGYRRTKTTIELPSSNAAYVARQLIEVEPADL